MKFWPQIIPHRDLEHLELLELLLWNSICNRNKYHYMLCFGIFTYYILLLGVKRSWVQVSSLGPKSADNHLIICAFLFCLIYKQRLELPRRRRTQSGFCEANLWAEPTSLVTRTKKISIPIGMLIFLVQLSLPLGKLNITLRRMCKISLCFSTISLWAKRKISLEIKTIMTFLQVRF